MKGVELTRRAADHADVGLDRICDTSKMISTMVFHGHGVAVVPEQCVPPPLKLDLIQIPLAPSAKPSVLGLLLKKQRPKVSLIEVFFEQLVQVIKAEEP